MLRSFIIIIGLHSTSVLALVGKDTEYITVKGGLNETKPVIYTSSYSYTCPGEGETITGINHKGNSKGKSTCQKLKLHGEDLKFESKGSMSSAMEKASYTCSEGRLVTRVAWGSDKWKVRCSKLAQYRFRDAVVQHVTDTKSNEKYKNHNVKCPEGTFVMGIRRGGTNVKYECGKVSYPLELREMDGVYVGEEKGCVLSNSACRPPFVIYYSDEQRDSLKITMRNGKFYNSLNRPFYTGSKPARFVMDDEGNVYSQEDPMDFMLKHSSFLAGKPVASAGMINVSSGVVKSFSDNSGHYKPETLNNIQFKEYLLQGGMSKNAVNDLFD